VDATGGADFAPGSITDLLRSFFVEIRITKVSRSGWAEFAALIFTCIGLDIDFGRVVVGNIGGFVFFSLCRIERKG